eukprot:scaffold831_cov39-Phaeocystis_antarctica.AAC.1
MPQTTSRRARYSSARSRWRGSPLAARWRSARLPVAPPAAAPLESPTCGRCSARGAREVAQRAREARAAAGTTHQPVGQTAACCDWPEPMANNQQQRA